MLVVKASSLLNIWSYVVARRVSNSDTTTDSRTHEELKRPSLYRVILHNDDYTTMEFVVMILESVFNKPSKEAFRIMFNVHNDGVGICGVYTYEVAETKIATVHSIARESGWPLKCSMEPE